MTNLRYIAILTKKAVCLTWEVDPLEHLKLEMLDLVLFVVFAWELYQYLRWKLGR